MQYLKSRPNDHQIKASLHFLLTAMNVIKRRNPLTESFLVQLDVDLQSAGLEESRALRTRLAKMDAPSELRQHPMGRQWDAAHEPPYKKPPTFGDLGLAKHVSPDQVSFATNIRQSKAPVCITNMLPSETQSSNMSTYGTYGKTPSFQPSPNSEDFMDTTNDLVEMSSADSAINRSSRGSITSISPPAMGQENGQPAWDSYNKNGQIFAYSNDHQTTNQNQFGENGYYNFNDLDLNQPISAIHLDPTTKPTAEDVGFRSDDWMIPNTGTGMTPGEPNSFSAAGMGFTPGPTGLTPAATGLTPGVPSDSFLNMSEAEWTQMMDDEMLNLGWGSTLADQSVFHYAESTTRKDGSNNWNG